MPCHSFKRTETTIIKWRINLPTCCSECSHKFHPYCMYYVCIDVFCTRSAFVLSCAETKCCHFDQIDATVLSFMTGAACSKLEQAADAAKETSTSTSHRRVFHLPQTWPLSAGLCGVNKRSHFLMFRTLCIESLLFFPLSENTVVVLTCSRLLLYALVHCLYRWGALCLPWYCPHSVHFLWSLPVSWR